MPEQTNEEMVQLGLKAYGLPRPGSSVFVQRPDGTVENDWEYVSFGKTNVTVKKGDSTEAVDLDEFIALQRAHAPNVARELATDQIHARLAEIFHTTPEQAASAMEGKIRETTGI